MWDHGAEINGSISVARVPKAFEVCETKKITNNFRLWRTKTARLGRTKLKQWAIIAS